MREELIKFDRYQKQFKFLYENRIETVGELITYYRETETKISEIIEMKREIYSHCALPAKMDTKKLQKTK